MLFRKEQTDKFPAVGARGAKVLSAQIVQLITSILRLDDHYLRGERIVIVVFVLLLLVLQVYFENKTFFVLLIYLMIE